MLEENTLNRRKTILRNRSVSHKTMSILGQVETIFQYEVTKIVCKPKEP